MSYEMGEMGGMFSEVGTQLAILRRHPVYHPPAHVRRGHRHGQRMAMGRLRGGLQGYEVADDGGSGLGELEGLFSFIGKAIKGIGKGIFGAVKGVAKGVGFVGKNVGVGLFKGVKGLGKGIYQVGKFAVPLAAGAFLGFNPFGGGGQQPQQQLPSDQGGGPIYFPYPAGPTGGGPTAGPRPFYFPYPTGAPGPTDGGGGGGGGGGGFYGGGGGGGGTPLMTTPQGGQVYDGAPPADNTLPLVLAGVAAVLLLSRR